MKKEKKDWEQRSYQFDIRAEEIDGQSILTGHPIVYESEADMYYYKEIIRRDALNGTDLTDVRFLVNHDTKRIPLARSRRNTGTSTMFLQANHDGLDIRVTLDTENNAEARSLCSAVKRGDISGMSFMFSIDSETWEDLESDYPTRYIDKIGKVVEVSAVTFPAYGDTTISTRGKEAVDHAREQIEKAKQASLPASELELEKLKLQIKLKMT